MTKKELNKALANDEPIAPPEREEEVVPLLDDLITDRKVRLEAIRLLTSEREWAEKESEAKKARKPFTTKLKSIFGKYRVGVALWDEYRINYYSTEGRETVNVDKLTVALLSRGICTEEVQDIIAASTDVGNPSYTLRITKNKGEAEEVEA